MSRLFERIDNFNNAFELYKEMREGFLANKQHNAYRLGLTQSFEIVAELGWKVLKDYLFVQGIETNTPKDVIKEAFSNNIIDNGQIWIDMIKDRNATSHEYNTEKVDMILEKISTIYYEELSKFQNFIRSL